MLWKPPSWELTLISLFLFLCQVQLDCAPTYIPREKHGCHWSMPTWTCHFPLSTAVCAHTDNTVSPWIFFPISPKLVRERNCKLTPPFLPSFLRVMVGLIRCAGFSTVNLKQPRGQRNSQLKNCLRLFCGRFCKRSSWVMTDVETSIDKWAWVVVFFKANEQVSYILPWALLCFQLEFLPQLPSVMDCYLEI